MKNVFGLFLVFFFSANHEALALPSMDQFRLQNQIQDNTESTKSPRSCYNFAGMWRMVCEGSNGGSNHSRTLLVQISQNDCQTVKFPGDRTAVMGGTSQNNLTDNQYTDYWIENFDWDSSNTSILSVISFGGRSLNQNQSAVGTGQWQISPSGSQLVSRWTYQYRILRGDQTMVTTGYEDCTYTPAR
jgi:hypothetical protein